MGNPYVNLNLGCPDFAVSLTPDAAAEVQTKIAAMAQRIERLQGLLVDVLHVSTDHIPSRLITRLESLADKITAALFEKGAKHGN